MRFAWMCVGIAFIVGCGKEAPATSGPPPVNAPASTPKTSSPGSTSGGGSVSQPSNPTPAPSSGGGGGGEVVAEPSGSTTMPNIGDMMTAPVAVMIEQKRKIAILNAEVMIKEFQAANDRWPKTFEEAGMGGPVPKPADGWRWKYDPMTGAIEMVKD